MDRGVERGVLDGVATFVAHDGRPTLTATLMFRFGMADEPLVASGWMHLLEHMALHGVVPGRLDVNGSVGLLVTRFDVSGEPRDVAWYLTALTERLLRVDPQVFAHEVRVLGLEAERRPPTPLTESLIWRFGAQGPGIAGYQEPGLVRASPIGLEYLAREVFTSCNAALCLSGDVPDGLRLHLPPGALRPTMAVEPWSQPMPGAYGHYSPEVIGTGLLRRSTAALAATRLVTERVFNHLRHAQGVAYSPGGSYEVVAGDTALAAVWARVGEAEIAGAAALINGAVRDIAANGPHPDELSDYVSTALRYADDPVLRVGRVWAQATDHLVGWEHLEDERLTGELRELSASLVASAATEFVDSLLIGVPVGTKLELPGVPVIAGPDNAGIPGKVFHPAHGATSLVGQGNQFVTNGTYLQRKSPAGNLTVDLSNLAGVLAWPDGARRLIRPDGYALGVEPKLWSQGKKLVAWIDGAVPEGVMLPQPQRKPEDIPRLPTLGKRLRHLQPLTKALIVILIVTVGGGLVLVLMGHVEAAWRLATIGTTLALLLNLARGLQKP